MTENNTTLEFAPILIKWSERRNTQGFNSRIKDTRSKIRKTQTPNTFAFQRNIGFLNIIAFDCLNDLCQSVVARSGYY